MHEEFRVIPGYDAYAVTRSGKTKSLPRDLVLKQYLFNGYFIVDTFRGSATETLPVHRAVALAWVENTKPDLYNVVNHLDGNPVNNWWENLEWTDTSGNNYHAINNGLRPDNIRCKVRDFYTKQIHEFNSIAQAAEFMGMRKDTSIKLLQPKMFGTLLAEQYELRFANDPRPWFYESREAIVPSSRFMVVVSDSQGVKEIYSNAVLLKEYQLYGSPSKSITGMVEYANKLYPDKKFTVRDGYAEAQYRETRITRMSRPIPVLASGHDSQLSFFSLTQCAEHFDVDRSSILNRLNNGKDLDGWTFTQASVVGNN